MSVVEGIGASASASIAVAVAAAAGQQLQASPLDARRLVPGRLRCSCAVTSQLPALVTTEAAEGGAAHCPAYRLTSSLACLPTDCLSPTYLLLVTTITASPPHHHRYFCPSTTAALSARARPSSATHSQHAAALCDQHLAHLQHHRRPPHPRAHSRQDIHHWPCLQEQARHASRPRQCPFRLCRRLPRARRTTLKSVAASRAPGHFDRQEEPARHNSEWKSPDT